ISAWARQRQTAVDPLEPTLVRPDTARMEYGKLNIGTAAHPLPTGSAMGRSTPRARVLQRTSVDVDLIALRTRAHELIDRMPAEQLLALPLSLGMLYRR